MAISYYRLENYGKNGTTAISLSTFEAIATIAASSLEDVTVTKKRKDFWLTKPVSASLKKDGRVQVSLEVNVKKGAKVDETCTKIQQEVASAIEMMCETVPVRIIIKVAALQ
ncbi:MAG: Asp23/Gls24 family envelope stress response protein [Bacilli bacterium]|jgi:uncharacterized alkaline shock family protein YloU|nr:Asp23/Gls24 family envelope stress response protein [Bacilli bacterium]